MKFTARQPGTNVNVSPTHPLKEFAVLAGSLLAIVVGVYLALGLAVDLIAPRLSMDLEKKLGGVFIGRLVETDEVADATRSLQALVDRLQERCAPLPYTITVHVQQSDAVNAAALPGGHMVVFTGLLAEMTSENELAFVLAHELGHYAHRDHLRGLGRALVLMTASTALLGADNSINSMIGQGIVLTELSFSRKQETQADEFALETLFCHYGHVADATSFFSKIPEDGDPGRFGHYFASHPENRRRIGHLDDLAQERGYPTGNPLP
ncbi:MAG: M48 family metallopeptidase, partial [Desulfosarcina sp.]|nr:M48 family metallopeptidase [Desulfosarcina sp.]MBC2765158.1 M48 family metallopeptidase [Desulfosarcina sp.]